MPCISYKNDYSFHTKPTKNIPSFAPPPTILPTKAVPTPRILPGKALYTPFLPCYFSLPLINYSQRKKS